MLHKIHLFASKYLLWPLIATYFMAGVVPRAGVAMRNIEVLDLPWFAGAHFVFFLPAALLALMLFNAGLCMRTSEVGRLCRRPRCCCLGFF